jgi:glutaryl-CoA dehydrogenase
MASMGLLGGNLPEEYGCANMNNVAYGLVMQELERGDSGIRSFVSVQGALVMFPIHAFGSDAQKKKWLPLLARGEKIGCFGLTEPDHGSDPGSMETRAQRKGRGFVLNGTKRWITNGSIADSAIVWARLDGDVRGFIVETNTPGFQAPEIKNKLSLRASVTSDLNLDDVEVSEDSLLPETGGIRSPLMCLNQARYGIAWGALGAAMACYEWAVDYTKQRTQFGKPVAAFQLVGKVPTCLRKLPRDNCWHGDWPTGIDNCLHANVSGKRNNVRIALKTADWRDRWASGITLEYPVFRNMHLKSVYLRRDGPHSHADPGRTDHRHSSIQLRRILAASIT